MIGIICAMHDEVAELLATLTNVKTSEIGNRTYHQGYIKNTPAVIAFSKWGKVAAAITTTQMIQEFKPIEIIFTGVAGGLQSDLNIGDLIYATDLVQHDMDASPLFPQFEIPLMGIANLPTQENKKLLKAIKLFLSNYDEHINTQEKNNFKIQKPAIYKGQICSGDQFINSSEKIEQLTTSLPHALCVEMEGAAVAQVCSEYNMPLNIIRTISDKANEEAHIDFPRFTREVSSKYAKGILEIYCD